MTPRPRLLRATLAGTAALAWLGAGCAEPALTPDPAPEEEPPPPTADELALGDDTELAAELERVREMVAAALEELAAAAEADDLSAARAAAHRALDRILAEPSSSAGPPALLPAESADREVAGDQADGLTTLLTLARDGSGELAGRTLEALREPIAGDLGAWERDAAGVVEGVRATIQGSDHLEELEVAVRDLPGDATSALAWTLLATDAGDRAALSAYAERAAAHLEVVAAALERLAAPVGNDTTGGS